MISADVVFYTFMIIVGFIATMRGWVREVIVTFSLVFALFVLNYFSPQIGAFAAAWPPIGKWAAFAVPFLIIAGFGYVGPAIAKSRFDSGPRGRFEESLLSFLLGCFNAFIIFSAIAFWANQAGILSGDRFPTTGRPLFLKPEGGWTEFFFIKNSAAAFFQGSTLVLFLIAIVLFVLIVVI
jgi:hypothetical protein